MTVIELTMISEFHEAGEHRICDMIEHSISRSPPYRAESRRLGLARALHLQARSNCPLALLLLQLAPFAPAVPRPSDETVRASCVPQAARSQWRLL